MPNRSRDRQQDLRLAVSAHDDKAFETAVFSGVELGAASPAAAVPQPGLKVITLPSGDQRVADH